MAQHHPTSTLLSSLLVLLCTACLPASTSPSSHTPHPSTKPISSTPSPCAHSGLFRTPKGPTQAARTLLSLWDQLPSYGAPDTSTHTQLLRNTLSSPTTCASIQTTNTLFLASTRDLLAFILPSTSEHRRTATLHSLQNNPTSFSKTLPLLLPNTPTTQRLQAALNTYTSLPDWPTLPTEPSPSQLLNRLHIEDPHTSSLETALLHAHTRYNLTPKPALTPQLLHALNTPRTQRTQALREALALTLLRHTHCAIFCVAIDQNQHTATLYQNNSPLTRAAAVNPPPPSNTPFSLQGVTFQPGDQTLFHTAHTKLPATTHPQQHLLTTLLTTTGHTPKLTFNTPSTHTLQTPIPLLNIASPVTLSPHNTLIFHNTTHAQPLTTLSFTNTKSARDPSQALSPDRATLHTDRLSTIAVLQTP